jgi:hypothetical protein
MIIPHHIKEKMEQTMSFVLQNLECTACQESYDWMAMAPDYHESTSTNELQKGWNLYIKEFETYRAFVLWHPTLQKDWSQVFPKKESVTLLDEHQNQIMTLESVGIQGDFMNWVPSEKDQSMYERILDQPKTLHSSINALYIGTYFVQFS